MKKILPATSIAAITIALSVFGGLAPANASTIPLPKPVASSDVSHTNGGYCAGCFHAAPQGALTKCQKAAIAAGFISVATVAATTTPLDVPGMFVFGSISYLGTRFFCEIGY